MVIDQQKNTQIEQNSILQNNIDNLKEAETLDAVHDYQKNINNFQAETESSILVQSIQAPEKSMLTKGMDNEEPSMLTKGLNEEKTPQTLSREELQKVVDNQTLKTVANERIGKCNELLDGLEGNRKGKKDLKKQVTRAIDTDLRPMTEDNHVYNNLNVYKNRLGKIVFDYYNNREPARQIIMMGGRAPVINGSADTKREARQDRRSAKNNANFQIDMSEIKRSTALYRLIGASANEWGNYCDFIGQGGIATSHPLFVQCTAGFNLVRQYNPDVYRAITPKGKITYDTYCQRNPKMYQTYCRNVYHQKSFNEKIGTGLADIAERLGVNKDNDPRKRQAREKAGSIVALGGAVVLGFQFLKNLFSSKKDNPDKRKNAGLYGGGLLALLNLDKIANRAQDITGWHPAEKSRMLAESFKTYGFSDAQAIEMTDRYIGAPVTTMSALHFIPIYELESQHILENKNGEIEFNNNNLKAYVNKFAWDKDQKEQVLKAGDKLDKDKSIGVGLKAFGIATWDKLRSLFGSDKKKTLADTDEVKNGWEKMVERVQHGVNKDLYNHGLRIKNPDDMDTIMAEYGDGQKSKEEVNKLMLDRMKRDLLELNSDDKSYTIKDILNNPDINLENMTMEGFTNDGGTEIPFDSYGDLFDTVRLTKRIKDNFSGRQAKSDTPFHIDELKGRIEFDDTERYELRKNETDVIKNRTLRKTSSLLTKNKKFYVNYLNKWRKEDQNRIIEENKVDLSGYPILKDVGINFTDENEAKKLETILEKIKNDLRFYYPTKFGNPFEIKDGVLKIKIEFTTIGENKKTWDISGIKTLSNEENKKKLLNYMNNKTNKMWGSYLK